MQRQKGAALVIVLALLAGSLMIGISGMNSALIDERLAGNYRASALAQMAAEKGGSDRREEGNFNSSGNSDSCLNIVDTYDLDDFNSGGEVNSEVYQSFSVRYDYRGCDYNGEKADFVVGQVVDSGGNVVAEHPLVVGQASGGGSGGSTTGTDDFPTSLDSSLLCVGTSCPSNNPLDDYFFGEADLPESFDCQGNGCRRDSGDSNSYGQADNLSDWEKFVSSLSSENPSSGKLSQGSRDNPNLIEIKEGDEAESKGNTNTSGIIVVRSGAVFNAKGTGSHEGLIIVEGSKDEKAAGQVTLGKNFSLYGSLVTFNGMDNISIGQGNATPNGGARYNASALTGLPKAEGEGGSGYVWLPL